MNIDESYRELGLAPGCSEAEAKEAWRKLAAHWHPDRNRSPHALRKIQRINRALEEIRRARSGAAAAQAESRAEPRPQPRPQPRPAAAPEVVEHTVAITLEEACVGCSRELQGEVVEECDACAGGGLQAKVARCADCEGTGRARSPLWFSWMTSPASCERCHGTGSARPRCVACEGSGRTRPRKYRCAVQVPAGTRAGEVLAISARVQGRQRQHDLALRVRVELQPHPFFSLDADGTVRCEMPVDGFAWMAERWIEVPTPRGPQQMRLRRSFLSYRIKGAGLPADAPREPADLMVTVVPLFPEELGKEQQALVDRLVTANTGARGTPAGARMEAWRDTVARWEAARAPQKR